MHTPRPAPVRGIAAPRASRASSPPRPATLRGIATIASAMTLLRILLLCVASLCAGNAFAQAASPAARNEAGKVETVTGGVTITAPDRTTRTPKPGDVLYEGDAIATNATGELQAEMLDSGVIAVRPNTQMSITKYQAQGDANDTSVFGLLKGSFRSITGWIGKNNPSRYSINTPTATIGVRGTDHEPLVIPEGSSDGTPGTYDKVAAGGSYIQGKTGRVDVTPGRAGFFAQNGRERPRLLTETPRFYAPRPSDTRLQGRHEQVRATLDTRRAERQQFVRQRREQQRLQGGPGQRAGQGGAQGKNAAAAQARQQGAQEKRQQLQQQRQQQIQQHQQQQQQRQQQMQQQQQLRQQQRQQQIQQRQEHGKAREPHR